MATAATRDRLLDRMRSLSPPEFEVLCKTVLGERLRTAALTVTPASQDGGIDIEGRLEDDWFAADFGVQVKRYAADNRVGNDRIHRFAGALAENDYHVGTFVTTSSYTGPATETAERLPVKLVSGDDLVRSMVDGGVGVVRTGDGVDLDETFWDRVDESDERVPAGDVPLASNLDRVRAVLAALRHTDGTRDAVRRWAARNRGLDLSDRHVYINANAATVLGLARTEPTPRGDAARWGVTASGAEYLNAHPESAAARAVLEDAIRDVDLVRRVRSRLVDAGELSREAVDDCIAAETTGLSQSSVERRGSALRSWLAELPEVEETGGRAGKTYVHVGDGDVDDGGVGDGGVSDGDVDDGGVDDGGVSDGEQ
ncbi:restriction endonuclease [Halomicrococcus gelatinilyticus]|uniref:restriction endonuclease n=1 Tax=Halomicrococcus gelatinilyticus TaxID=1702103 RepID=UPI002E167DD1